MNRIDPRPADDGPAPDREGVARDAFQVGRLTLLLGDCLSHLGAMAPGSVDVIVTSPPYNLGIKYGAYDDGQPRHRYLTWLVDVATALKRVLAPGGSLFVNVGATSADPWVTMDVGAVFRQQFVLQNNIQWIKSIAIGDDTVGHFKPINSDRFLNHNHETVFHFTHTGAVTLDRLAVGVPFKDKSNIARFGHERDRRCAGNTWFIPYRTVQSRAQKHHHPAGFPVELPERCLRLHGQAGARVLDPFMGTGSTLVAAARLGMTGVGIEIDPGYLRTALDRLSAGAGL
jgi:site-specific DNA-methyltransferase (adenine-specific)